MSLIPLNNVNIDGKYLGDGCCALLHQCLTHKIT